MSVDTRVPSGSGGSADPSVLDPERLRVLLVDDSEDSFRLTEHLLRGSELIDATLDWAPTWEDGLEQISSRDHDVYLVDYHLGDRDGLILIQKVRTLGIDAPIILFTGMGSSELDLVAVRQGADDYLDKTQLTKSLLSRTIRYAVQRKRDQHMRQELEGRLREYERKRSIEVLAGGIAHNFNNILMIISGHADIIHEGVAAGSALEDSVRTIHDAVRRASHLTRHLLIYSENPRMDPRPECLTSLIEGWRSELAETTPPAIELRLGLQTGLPLVSIDRGQFREIVRQLVRNSVEAIGTGPGTIEIRTGLVPAARLDPQSLAYHSGRPETDHVFASVRDDGPGIDPVMQNRIFDPFYSTKSVGRGLGLSAALGVVLSHAGAVQIRSNPGEGTEVRVYFPAC